MAVSLRARAGRVARAVLLAGTASLPVAAAAVAALAVPASAARVPVHVMPVRTRPRSGSSAPITFHGGAVMTGATHLYLVWYGPWATHAKRRAILAEFVQHLDSPYWAINATYKSGAGVPVGSAPVLSGQVDDAGSQGLTQLTDDQIQAVVQSAVHSKALPKDRRGIYLVVTSSSVTKQGFLSQYCGWHSDATIDGATIKFGFIGDPSGPKVRNCSPQSISPNGDVGADAMASTIAHELSETVTDPTMMGWRTSAGEENADRCAWQYGTVYKVGNAYANVRLHGHDYLLQENWVNDASPHCGLSATGAHGAGGGLPLRLSAVASLR